MPEFSPDLTINADGGARGNPGPAAIGFVIKDKSGRLIHQAGETIGHATNNIAEYRGVIAALTWINQNLPPSPRRIHFYLDSNLIVNQLLGRFKIKQPHLKTLCDQVKLLEFQTQTTANYTYIPRAQNALADRLVNLALDQA